MSAAAAISPPLDAAELQHPSSQETEAAAGDGKKVLLGIWGLVEDDAMYLTTNAAVSGCLLRVFPCASTIRTLWAFPCGPQNKIIIISAIICSLGTAVHVFYDGGVEWSYRYLSAQIVGWGFLWLNKAVCDHFHWIVQGAGVRPQPEPLVEPQPEEDADPLVEEEPDHAPSLTKMLVVTGLVVVVYFVSRRWR